MGESVCLDPRAIRKSRQRSFVHRYMDWGQVRADVIKRTGLERQETSLARSSHVFIVNLQGAVHYGEDVVDGRRLPFAPRRAGSLIYVPANSEWTGWDDGEATAAYLLVCVEPELAADVFAEKKRYRLPNPQPAIGFRDSAVEMALQRIALEVTNPDPLSLTMVQGQAMQLIVQMTRMHGLARSPAKGGLSPFDLRRALEIIETPGRAPTLPELANAVGLSRFHFWRAFKQSTGMTPYAFMAKKRLEKAAEMLRATKVSATEIAFDCNFASSSHFTTAFKRAFGVTPTEFRVLCQT